MAYTRPEPLRRKHSLNGFRSGEASLDEWLVRYARHAESAGTARVFVTTEDGTLVAGYYALTVSQVLPEDATARLMKGTPAETPVPVALLARLAVDEQHQGRGLGRSLLQDALLKCATAADSVGVRAVAVNALTEVARDFYSYFGFECSPTDPLHLILLMKDLKKFLAEVDTSSGRGRTARKLRELDSVGDQRRHLRRRVLLHRRNRTLRVNAGRRAPGSHGCVLGRAVESLGARLPSSGQKSSARTCVARSTCRPRAGTPGRGPRADEPARAAPPYLMTVDPVVRGDYCGQ